ncbi:unnamed protein product [Durusdinium trenchii]|uniref:Uncharacterized protein n=2 Tax=Durusdinium trenchii TaxID=1381693 RepID=A0ABP0JDC0_9DINO
MTEAALPLFIREPTGPLQRCRVKQVIILAATFTAGFACGFSAANPKLSTPTASSLWLPRPCGPDDATTTSTESPKLEITPHAWHASSSLPHSTTSTHSTTRAKMGSTSTTLPSSETIIVKVFAGGNGRLGNNIGQLLHGLAFARRIHADKVQLVASGGQLPQVMELKDLSLDLPDAGTLRGVIPKECNEAAQAARMNKEPNTYASGFWTTRCSGVPGSEYHDLAFQYIWPLLKSEVKECVEKPDDAAEKRLTVHLRGQDLWNMGEFDQVAKKPINMSAGAHHWLWNNPPCTMYEKIIQEDGYSDVLVVTSQDRRHACVSWFEELPRRTGLKVNVTFQTSSLAEDFCALVKSRNMVVSFSTLSNAAAVLSKNLKRIYVRNFAQNSMLNCQLWPTVSIMQYYMPSTEQHHEPYNNTYAGVIEWFQTYNVSLIARRTSCK